MWGLSVVEDDCDEFSMWSICPGSPLYSLKTLMLSCNFCTTNYFPYVYWIMICVSIIHLINSCRKLRTLISMHKKKLHRKWRVCSTLMMLKLWIFLIYGCINIKLDLIILWQIVQGLKLFYQFLFWIVKILLGSNITDTKVSFIFTFLSSIMMLMSVQCVRRVLKRAVMEDDIENLNIFI